MLPKTVAVSIFVYAASPDLPSSVWQGKPCIAQWAVRGSDNLANNQASNEQLEEICSLAENWDGYGGSRIHDETSKNARTGLRIFQQFALVPEMIPNANGTISFEWSSSRGEAYLEIGRTRYVGLIQPHGASYIPLAGETGQYGTYDANIRHFAETVAAVLFPKTVSSLTSSKYTAAAHDRQAA